MSRTAKTILSEIKVVLNSEGNLEVEYSNVPLKEFESEMNRKVPEYENTHIIAGFIKKLQKLSSDYYNDINKLLI